MARDCSPSLSVQMSTGLIATSEFSTRFCYVLSLPPAFGMTSFTIAILITQVLGYVLALVGLCLCIMACEPVHGPLLISGLGIIALAELLGLVYMKFVGKLILLFKPLQRISDT